MRLSIQQQLLALVALPLLVVAYPLLGYLPQKAAEAQRRGLEAKVQSLGELLAHNLAPEVELGMSSSEDLRKQFSGLERDHDLRDVAVYDADAKLLSSLLPGAAKELPAGVQPGLVASDELLILTVPLAGQEGQVGWLRMEASLQRVYEQANRLRLAGALVGAATLALSFLLSLLLGRSIAGRIVAASEVVRRVAAGDLSFEVPPASGSSELAAMFADLRNMVAELRTLEEQVRAVADCDLRVRPEGRGDLSVAFARLVDRQRQLAQALSETTAALETSSRELLATLRQQEANANEQASAVEEVRRTMDSLLVAAGQIAEASQQVFENASATKGSSEKTAKQASLLNERTSRIVDVLTAINKIADRSDLLALNAALEGTKAGEAGRGFILVAEEMRRLAENVTAAVQDISELIDGIRSASQSSVLATEQGVKLSLETTRSAELIRMTSQQQRSGTEQATESMNEMCILIDQNVSGARQSTQAVAELSSRASALREMLAIYRLDEEGQGPSSAEA